MIMMFDNDDDGDDKDCQISKNSRPWWLADLFHRHKVCTSCKINKKEADHDYVEYENDDDDGNGKGCHDDKCEIFSITTKVPDMVYSSVLKLCDQKKKEMEL